MLFIFWRNTVLRYALARFEPSVMPDVGHHLSLKSGITDDVWKPFESPSTA